MSIKRTLFCLAISLAFSAAVKASRSYDGVSAVTYASSSAIGSNPAAYTITAWVKGASQDNKIVLSFGTTISNNPILILGSGASAAGQSGSALRLNIRDDNLNVYWGNSAGDAAGTAFDSTWHHVAGRWNGTNASIAVDGSVVATSGTLVISSSTFNRTGIGALVRAANSLFFNGLIARVAIWNVALTDDELHSLGAGISPLSVRPSGLVFYVPLWPTAFDYRKGESLTDSSAASGDHPRIYR